MKLSFIRSVFLLTGIFLISSILFQSCENEEYDELNDILSQTAQSGDIITESAISDLPVLIQNHLRLTGVIGTPKHFNLKMEGTGGLKQTEEDNWNDLTNTFYLTFSPVSRFWFGEIDTRLGKMSGFDYYRDGQGRLSIRYVASVSFQEANDEKTTRSELITFMSEHVYNPTAFLNNYFTWVSSTDTSVTATLSDAGISVSGTYFFGKNGLIEKFISTERYKGSGDGARVETWEVTLWDYKEFDGISIPVSFKAVWLQEKGPFEYIHGSISNVYFDITEL